MSTRDILEELPRLSSADLKAIQRRITEIAAGAESADGNRCGEETLQIENSNGHLVLAGSRVIRQSQVQAILNEFP